MLREAIQYVQGMSVESAVSLGFSRFEVRYEDIEAAKEIAGCGGEIIGIVKNVSEMTAEAMKACIDKAGEYGAGYIILDTRGIASLSGISKLLEELSDVIASAGIKIYIENGYICSRGGHYHGESSDAGVLCRLVEKLNRTAGRIFEENDKENNHKNGGYVFGICINVGYANLLGINVSNFIIECGKYLAVMHMSDNNGISDQQQMPYTFTTGRGINSTDWYHIIGALYKLRFDGLAVFDTVGTFKRTPTELHQAMLELLRGIYSEWEACFNIEHRLNKPEKKLILFGAGKMAENYMDAFGEKYPPQFLVDNNSKIWGTKILGLEVKSPEAILEIPEDKRNVWICNTYYDAIGLQLDRMGVEYECYFDHYYL